MYVEQPSYRLTAGQIGKLLLLGQHLDLAPGPGGSRITPLAETFIPDVAMTLQIGSVEQASFVALYPSSQLVAHCDPPVRSRWNRSTLTRFHVPLSINEGCWVFHTGTWQQLELGRIYQMDPTQLHGAVNWGTTIRKHLIVDAM